jgi:hypothetical protein
MKLPAFRKEFNKSSQTYLLIIFVTCLLGIGICLNGIRYHSSAQRIQCRTQNMATEVKMESPGYGLVEKKIICSNTELEFALPVQSYKCKMRLAQIAGQKWESHNWGKECGEIFNSNPGMIVYPCASKGDDHPTSYFVNSNRIYCLGPTDTRERIAYESFEIIWLITVIVSLCFCSVFGLAALVGLFTNFSFSVAQDLSDKRK